VFLHPGECGNIVVLEKAGMHLQLCMMVKDGLTCYAMKPDDSDQCHVAFSTREYVAGERGMCLDGSMIKLVEVILPDNKNRMV
jgi:hypothetical protein